VTFAYEAARTDGALVRGRLEAGSQAEAAALLSARGLFPIAVGAPSRRTDSFRQPSTRALATVFQSLSALTQSGVPLHKALHVTRGLAKGKLADALERVEARVRNGSSLATALTEEGDLFPVVAIGLVRAGERGVGLDTALLQTARELERKAETAARLRATLAYPLLLILVGTASIGLITFFVVPRFATLLGDLGQTLPPTTRILLSFSSLLRRYGVVIGAIVVAGFGAGLKATRERRASWHGWLLSLPVIGPIRHALATARATRTLGALLSTSTPALTALSIAHDASGDAAVADRLQAARERVAQGAGLTAALQHAQALTPSALELAAIGESSGTLPSLLTNAAEIEDQRVEQQLKTLVAFAEPALILAFASIVAFVAAALLQAVYSLRPGL